MCYAGKSPYAALRRLYPRENHVKIQMIDEIAEINLSSRHCGNATRNVTREGYISAGRCFAAEKCAKWVSSRPLILGVDRKCVWKQKWKQKWKLQNEPLPPGRPLILNQEQADALCGFIREQFERHDPASVDNCLNFPWETFVLRRYPQHAQEQVITCTVCHAAKSVPLSSE